MNEDIDAINRMRAITLSREYGSGGGEIASRLAKRLGWDLIDHAIVERTARELGTSQEEAEAHDEYTEGRVSRVLNSMLYLSPASMVIAPPEAFLSDEEYRSAVNKLVRAAAVRGHVKSFVSHYSRKPKGLRRKRASSGLPEERHDTPISRETSA